MAKVPISRDELERKLADKLRQLERSANAFDEGANDEFERIALLIRVLVHDEGRNSHSLLSQLNRKGEPLLDTAKPLEPGNLFTESTLTITAVDQRGFGSLVAPLDRYPPNHKLKSFDDWWAQVVIKDKHGRELSRRDLIRTAADQEGAHVDDALEETYSDLSRNNSLLQENAGPGWKRPVEGAERATIRQIGHEVLKSFVPGYGKALVKPPGSLEVLSMSMTPTPPDMAIGAQPRRGLKQGRNERCACGSGRKFKHCCGAHP